MRGARFVDGTTAALAGGSVFFPRGERESLVREDGFYFEVFPLIVHYSPELLLFKAKIPKKIKYLLPTAFERICLLLGAAEEAIGGEASRDHGANVILQGCQDPVSF
ncbi:hypothetical protein SKAU_G00396920 [Synaphobranchus kaupii]|uniref:Uncharacterized protein n=1 Tax=Synaphobranchus kaupii TaxID=118154 RepID=A0A9Q1ECN0_SYNKA|nr:hypothetical protein SKAU_G00396920 [Synaphobranchus kaupii]